MILLIETFNKFFASVFTADDGTTPEVDDSDNPPSVTFNSFTFTLTPVAAIKATCMKILEPSTYCGTDGLPNIFLRNCSSSLALPLCHIFLLIF
jgi:hypothetical protein